MAKDKKNPGRNANGRKNNPGRKHNSQTQSSGSKATTRQDPSQSNIAMGQQAPAAGPPPATRQKRSSDSLDDEDHSAAKKSKTMASALNPQAKAFQPSQAQSMQSVAAASNATAPLVTPPTRQDLSIEYMDRLRSFVEPQAVLKKKGYVFQQLSASDLELKKKCQRCHKVMKKGTEAPQPSKKQQEGDKQLADGEQKSAKALKPGAGKAKARSSNYKDGEPSKKAAAALPEPVMRCKFHEGVISKSNRKWSCCGKGGGEFTAPCKEAEFHLSESYEAGELEDAWKYYETPQTQPESVIKRAAVAIDCEMGTAKSGDSELIRVSVVDYFTSEVLIDHYVWPDVPMSHLNTKFSGVTWNQLNSARWSAQCFMGKKKAREAVWEFVGPDTVVVGHALDNDLTALRWIHHAIVDTCLIEYLKLEKERKEQEARELEAKAEKAKTEQANNSGKEIADHDEEGSNLSKAGSTNADEKPVQKKKKGPKGSGPLSLKTQTMAKYGRAIQVGNFGHDSLEDAIASRDLAHWHVVNMGP